MNPQENVTKDKMNVNLSKGIEVTPKSQTKATSDDYYLLRAPPMPPWGDDANG
jgi:hypothetical protein